MIVFQAALTAGGGLNLGTLSKLRRGSWGLFIDGEERVALVSAAAESVNWLADKLQHEVADLEGCGAIPASSGICYTVSSGDPPNFLREDAAL